MMNRNDPAYRTGEGTQDGYPLQATAATLNQRLGLYLSPEQQRGLATGLLVGVALSAALLAWRIGTAIRRAL